MMNPKIEQLGQTFRESLMERLRNLARPLADYHKATSNLTALNVDVVETSTAAAVTQTLSGFLRDLETSLTRDYAGNGTVKVSFKGERGGDPRNFYRSEMDLRHLFRNIDSINDGFVALMNSYPFSDLADSAMKQCATLEDRGLQACADRLASRLHLVNHGGKCSVKAQRNRVISYKHFDSYFVGAYSYSDWDALYELARDMRVVEAEMGELGASEALRECGDLIKDASSRFETRTKLLEGRPVEFVVFNNHMDIRIRADVADTVLAFLALHSQHTIYDLALAA